MVLEKTMASPAHVAESTLHLIHLIHHPQRVLCCNSRLVVDEVFRLFVEVGVELVVGNSVVIFVHDGE